MRILITDHLAPRGLEIFKQANGFTVDVKEKPSPPELKACIGQYEGLIVRSSTRVTAEILQAAERLRVIGRAGVGVDNIDLEAATARGVVVMNTPTGNTITTAEHAIALLLALAKNVPQATASLKGGRWEKGRLVSVELFNKTLGVLGLGRIGSEVARRGKGLGMEVIATDPYISADAAAAIGVELVDLAELYRRADFVTIHVPLTTETRGLINRQTIARMKDGVRIINCARGGIVNEADLYDGLRSGKVAGAALDVFEREPITDSPLFTLEAFIGTPHLGAASEEAQENVSIEVAQQVIDYLQRGIIRNAVNAPSLPPELLRQLAPYLTLAEKLGRLESQLAEGRMQEIRIEYRGEIADWDTAPLTVAIVKGALDTFLPESVNFVNALTLAKRRGIRIREGKTTHEPDFASLITVAIKTDQGMSEVAGTLFNRRDPRVVRIDEFRLEAVPEGYLLVFSNLDVPGVIGRIGTLLGQNQVNIAGMQLGRERPGGRAVSVVNVDTPIPPQVLDEIRKIPNIVFAKLVKV